MSQSQCFSVQEVKEILRKEEEKRRRETKAREAEILALMDEQNLDYQGKLWGENSISAMAQNANGGDGTRWETDFEAKLVSHKHTPERALVVKQAFVMAKKTIINFWTETQWNFFLVWLDTQTWEELALETGYTPYACITLIKEMVSKLRRVAGSNPSTFPFSESLDQVARKKINQKVAQRRIFAGTSHPADPKNRVYITTEEKEMPLDALWELIKSRGHQISRATAHRAKTQGFYMKPGWQKGGEKVFLTDEDKTLSAKILSAKYGFSVQSARLARKRGYFIINPQNAEKIFREGRDVSALIEEEKNTKISFYHSPGKKVFWKVTLPEEDLQLSSRELMVKYCLQNITTASKIRSRQSKFLRLTLEQYKKFCTQNGLACDVS